MKLNNIHSCLINPVEVRDSTEIKEPKYIDCSRYSDRDAYQEYLSERIPGARFFDIVKISDKTSGLPNMLPTTTQFEETMNSFNITNEDNVVLYVGKNSTSAPRVWWTFKYFGHSNVYILNGGIEKWKDENNIVEKGPVKEEIVTSKPYIAHINTNLVVDSRNVLEAIDNNMINILDARGSAMFLEGHIPGSINIPFSRLLSQNNYNQFLDTSTLKKIFEDSGVYLEDNEKRYIATCATGVTACIILFSLHLLGIPLERMSVYDGSWSEWGANNDFPISK